MSKRHHHQTNVIIKDIANKGNVKSVAALISVELALFLFVAYKGLGWNYLPIACVLMIMTIIGSAAANYVAADKYLVTIVMLLLNMGFCVQEIETGSGVPLFAFMAKLVVMIVSVVLIFLLYHNAEVQPTSGYTL